MRVDTLVIIPLLVLSAFVLKRTNSESTEYGTGDYIRCDTIRPFRYKVDNNYTQCGFSVNDMIYVQTTVGLSTVFCLISYLITTKLKYIQLVFGQIVMFVSIYLYIHAYNAHAFCQSFIVSTFKTQKKHIYCKDDLFYVTIGLLFFISLLTIFHALCYIIVDKKSNMAMGDLDFSMKVTDKSTDNDAQYINEPDRNPNFGNKTQKEVKTD
ncbi:hypothetical protein EIN_409790 [Entamoeba invadens IP1]|uniref:Uncharacterized protein n=1 Tax=Entamoeba invadens IP1 TaxID=370355 RepID=A0A0A1TZP6_ENTIV|nr:hypothetical protein EIN_409790 [Entamoeba invadens IP1]ELP85660.1 hypothetical protein EIN_409790 [Entamoeba invadens IP1]|eukprot:XP_004185006.1 hypothetical protein EIN_409790 [Entamoeba invadens IP1]